MIFREEHVISSRTLLGSGDPAEGAMCGQRLPREYTAHAIPDLEFPKGRRRTLTAILRLQKNLFTVKLDQQSLTPVDQREERREQLTWQKQRFDRARGDDVSTVDLYDIDASTVVLFLMVRPGRWSKAGRLHA